MEYTHPVSISRGLAFLSPTHAIAASANGNVLQLHDIPSNSLITSMPTAGPIIRMAWSFNGPPVLAAVSHPAGNIVIVDASGQVIADIHGGLLDVSWVAVSGLGKLVVGYEQNFGVGIFNFFQKKQSIFIPFACRISAEGVLVPRVISPCDNFAVVVIRSAKWQDSISIINLIDGSIIKTVPNPAGISRIAGFRWVANRVLLWGRGEDETDDDKIAFLSVQGDLLSDKCVPNTDAVAIHTASSDDTSMLIALGLQQSRIRLLDSVRWRLIRDFNHKAPETCATAPPLVLREHRSSDEHDRSVVRSAFEIVECDTDVKIGRATCADGTTGSDDRDCKGVRWCEFSRDGRYVASRDEAARHVIMVWDVQFVRLAVLLIFKDEVLSIKWSNQGSRLVIGCGGPWVYLWDSRGAAAVRIGPENEWPPEFEVRKVAWIHDDSAVMLIDGSKARAFRIVFVN